jgi:hypothetical protein
VSIDGAGSLNSSPPGVRRSNCMNTRFQISSQPCQLAGSLVGQARGAPSIEKWISEHGPIGPVSPIIQKLSFAPSPITRSSPKPVTRFQIARASSSGPTPGSFGSPPNTVTHMRDASIP